MPLIEIPPDDGSIKDKLIWVLDVSSPGTKTFKTAVGYISMLLNSGKMAPGYIAAAHDLYRSARAVYDNRTKLGRALTVLEGLTEAHADNVLNFPSPDKVSS